MVSRSYVTQPGEDYANFDADEVAGCVEGIAERFVPGPDADQTVPAEHWARYMLAPRLAPGNPGSNPAAASGPRLPGGSRAASM